MALILTIDTSSEAASIALSQNGDTLQLLLNKEQKDHAAWIHEAIDQSLKSAGKLISNLSAVAVVNGPGSYTGLRVGMATAKGLCYALHIPLITLNSLKAMSYAALQQEADLYCPLIDARRMEVYTAMYNRQLEEIQSPTAMIIDAQSFSSELEKNTVLFFGSGSSKLKPLINSGNAIFSAVQFDAAAISEVIMNKYNSSDFADLTYSEPLYVKDVYIKR